MTVALLLRVKLLYSNLVSYKGMINARATFFMKMALAFMLFAQWVLQYAKTLIE